MDENRNYPNNGQQGYMNQNPFADEKTMSANDRPVGQQRVANSTQDPYYNNNTNNPFNENATAQNYSQTEYQYFQQNPQLNTQGYSQSGDFQQGYPNPSTTNQQYAQNYNTNNYSQPVTQGEPGKEFGVASLVCAIVGLIMCCIGFGIVNSIIGLIFGIISKNRKPQNNGIAIAGIIISAVAIAATLIVIIINFSALVEIYRNIIRYSNYR